MASFPTTKYLNFREYNELCTPCPNVDFTSLSVDLLYVTKEVTGAASVFIGHTGSQGSIGPQGSQGSIGPQGTSLTGSKGPQGSQGPQGTTGPAGYIGREGNTGPQGPQGFSLTGAQGSQGRT